MPINHPVGGDVLLTVKEAAHYLSHGGLPTSIGGLNSMRTNGNGPKYLKIGKIVYYREPTLESYLISRITDEVQSTSEMKNPTQFFIEDKPEE
jgi:hypothetical protein